jgi:hypothetical protein
VLLKIEVDEDGYQLLVGDQESGVTDYGDDAQVEVEGVLHFTTVTEDGEPEDAVIYRMVDGHPEVVAEAHEVEEVEFEFEEEDEDEGDEAAPA